ncbi:MAG: hypothetical protein MUE95_12240 [Cyclobacteriaceae bacterium]|jgi:hypothetical protein|nr:hypothetical protein [Cyclobacteriaceae bacterium]
MKTPSYNPSPFEVAIAQALVNSMPSLESLLTGKKIESLKIDSASDNPVVKFNLVDEDGDPHHMVVKIIQLPDTF